MLILLTRCDGKRCLVSIALNAQTMSAAVLLVLVVEKMMRLSRKGFLEWVNAHEPYDIVGRAVDSTCCPITTYLREITPVKTGQAIEVYPEGIFIYDEKKMEGRSFRELSPRALPDWAYKFTCEIDKRTVMGGGRELTRDDVLSIMAKI